MVAFIDNILARTVVYKTPSFRTSINYYYVNMAVSDFLSSLTLWPLYLTDEIITQQGSLIKGPMATVGCKVGVYVRVVSTSVSILSLVLIATDRYFGTVFPLKTSILLSRRVRITALVATWVISMGYCFPMIYFSKVEDVGEERFCRFAWNDTGALIIYYVSGISMINGCASNCDCDFVFSYYASIKEKNQFRTPFWKHKFRRQKMQAIATHYENIQINCDSLFCLLFSFLRLFDFKDDFP